MTASIENKDGNGAFARLPTGIVPLLACFLVAVFLFFVVYDPRTTVTLQESDGGEFAAAAARWSLVHPPGYPLYSWVASALVRAIPCNPYHTLASFSALCQALAAGGLVWVLAALSGSWLIAAALALGWAFFEATLRTAADAEVFALHHFLVVLLVGAALWASRAKHNQLLALAALSLALAAAASHHHTVVLFFPLAGALALSLPKPRLFASLFLGGALALLLYLSLFMRYRIAPELAFTPLQSGVDFLSYLLRGGYGTFSLAIASTEESVRYFGTLLAELWRSNPASILLSFCAVVFVVIRPSRTIVGAFMTFVLVLLFAAALKLPPPRAEYEEWIMRFYPTVALGLVLVAAVAFGELRWGRHPAAVLVTLLSMVAVLGTAPESLRRADASRDSVVQDEVESALFSAPRDAVLLVGSDRLAFGLRYQQTVLRAREDVLVLVSGMLESESYRRKVAEALGRTETESSEVLESVSEVGRSFIDQGRPVLAEWFIAPPEGVQAYRFGVLSTWHPVSAAQAPQFNPNFCDELPESLVQLSDARQRSRVILERSFIAPLRMLAPDKTEAEPLLFNPAFRKGRDIESVRAACRAWVEMVSPTVSR